MEFIYIWYAVFFFHVKIVSVETIVLLKLDSN